MVIENIPLKIIMRKKKLFFSESKDFEHKLSKSKNKSCGIFYLTDNILFQVKGDVESLVDKYFGSLYKNYEQSKKGLVRQARDLLVCEYHGNLQRFESEFCAQAEKLLHYVKVSPYNIDSNICYLPFCNF